MDSIVECESTQDCQDGITTNRQRFPLYSYLIVPNPMSLQLSPIRRLRATFEPASAQIGFFNETSARSSRAETTMPDVTAVPALRTSEIGRASCREGGR